MNLTITIPYDDYSKLVADASEKANVIKLLNTEFPDATCQLIAIKSMLGIVEEETNETPSTEPTEPSGDENSEGGESTPTE